MSNTWLKLEPNQTKKITTVIESDGSKYKNESTEHCNCCCKTNCVLIGCYGTWNEFGSFKGICLDCLKKLNRLHKKGSLYD